MDVGVTELRNNLSQYLDRVREGEDIVITERGLPVARLTNVDATDLIERLKRGGVLSPPKRTARRPLPPPIKANGTVSDLVERNR